MKHFSSVTSLDELKLQYKKLAFKNHPDRGGKTEVMQEINSEYEQLLNRIINEASKDQYQDSSENGRGFWSSRSEHSEVEKKVKQAIDAIINLDSLDIEIIGVWVWVSGDTKQHKDKLKEAGFVWNRVQCKWVFIGKKSNGRGRMTLDQMRELHGSQKVKKTRMAEERQLLTA
ncbi:MULTISPECIES: molecular chaperone DnaJ [Acinetobacter calcoaceticus/baumannii complex]|uniref:molecular chaperone DnaJ n=1 Tax=Acinetobacter calcoaceticus/baumannii complex TaxID=909768 RepID=UPI000F832EF6|nr:MULTISPECIES: molecular chaperone DnaJ [Acinetobacter calcoaceticus/baumannii complex]MDI9659634.1 molecular chaperone DnaJ [Acinetobacter nosocomialis]MDP7774587.1 molecular chaperone DnaJ [Acinetobacter nosocomialis]RTY12861.1 molecular chaperone DnaJ [Acinetobacter baumannii]